MSLSVALQQRLIRGVLEQSVLEFKDDVGRHTAPVDQSGGLKLSQRLFELASFEGRNGGKQLVAEGSTKC